MKITNTGDRVVCIGTVTLMPDQVVELGPEWDNNPSIMMLAHKNFIKVELDAPKPAPAPRKSVQAEPVQSASEAEAAPVPTPKPARKPRKAAADSEK